MLLGAAGALAGLYVIPGASGVVGVDDTRIDLGESITITYDNISHSQIGGPDTLGNFITSLNTVHFAAFGIGDAFTYTGVDGPISGTTNESLLSESITLGDTLTVTSDAGGF